MLARGDQHSPQSVLGESYNPRYDTSLLSPPTNQLSIPFTAQLDLLAGPSRSGNIRAASIQVFHRELQFVWVLWSSNIDCIEMGAIIMDRFLSVEYYWCLYISLIKYRYLL